MGEVVGRSHRSDRSASALSRTLNARIHSLARARGLSTRRLAAEAGIARSHLLDVDGRAGRKTFGLDIVARVGVGLRVDPAILFHHGDAEDDVDLPPTCDLESAAAELRRRVAINLRALAMREFGCVRVVDLSEVTGLHRASLYPLLGRRVSLSVDRIEALASRLGAAPVDLVLPLRAPTTERRHGR